MEHNRIDGPEARTRAPGITPGPGIQFGTFNINAVENEDELGCWYSQVRMPRLVSMEGCVGARNLVSVSGWAKHGILYEWVSLESLQKNFTTEKIPRSRQAVNTLVHAPSSPSLGRTHLAAGGGWLIFRSSLWWWTSTPQSIREFREPLEQVREELLGLENP